MNMNSGALCVMKRLDEILLQPCLSLRLGIHDKKSGTSSQEHSFTVSFGTTLLRMMTTLAFLFVICKVLCKIRRNKMESKWKAKYKKKLKQAKRK